MSALRNPVIGLLTLHMSIPSQHATTNNTIHTLDTQPTPELFTFSSVLQGHSRHPPNHTILRSHKPSHITAFAYYSFYYIRTYVDIRTYVATIFIMIMIMIIIVVVVV